MLGRRDNIHKARIKIIVNQMGIDKYRELVDKEWELTKNGALKVPDEEIERIDAYFAPPRTRISRTRRPSSTGCAPADRAFDRWMRDNVVEHKVPGYAIVNVSLKAPGRVPGDITADKMDAVADLADRYSFGEIRVSHRQNLVLVDVQAERAALTLARARCARARNAEPRSPVRHHLLPGARLLRARERALDPDCAGHQPRVHGPRRAAEDRQFHDQYLGLHERLRPPPCRATSAFSAWTSAARSSSSSRSAAPRIEKASLGDRLGPGLPQAEVPGAIRKIVDTYIELRQRNERFLDTYRRVGIEPFKGAVYGAETQAA